MLEFLDGRCVPAALTWTNGDGTNDFYDRFNWVVTGAGTTPPSGPVAGDDVTFDGTVSSANCPNLGLLPIGGGGGGTGPALAESSGAGLHSLSLINGYAGTVSIVAALQTESFTLSAGNTGAISQPAGYPGNDLTVTGNFTWTSGTLNSSTNNATLHLLAATATINPGDGNLITTGDSISLEALNGIGANATFLPGEVDFSGLAGVTVDQFCLADVRATGPDVTFGGDADKWLEQTTRFLLKSGATATVTGPGTWTGRNKRLVNNGGTLEVKGGATVVFGPSPNPQQPEYTIYQSTGFTKLHSGSTLKGL